MSWADYYRRRDAIDVVLARAGRHESYDDIALEVFGGSDELMLALRYKWSQQLHGRVAVALAEAEQAPDIDHVAAVATAWRTTARRHPTLRRLLDEYGSAAPASAAPASAGPALAGPASALADAARAEQRTLALAAGLADATEPPEEVARIGAAFQALIRTTPDRPSGSSNPVEQLFRRLVASS